MALPDRPPRTWKLVRPMVLPLSTRLRRTLTETVGAGAADAHRDLPELFATSAPERARDRWSWSRTASGPACPGCPVCPEAPERPAGPRHRWCRCCRWSPLLPAGPVGPGSASKSYVTWPGVVAVLFCETKSASAFSRQAGVVATAALVQRHRVDRGTGGSGTPGSRARVQVVATPGVQPVAAWPAALLAHQTAVLAAGLECVPGLPAVVEDGCVAVGEVGLVHQRGEAGVRAVAVDVDGDVQRPARRRPVEPGYGRSSSRCRRWC